MDSNDYTLWKLTQMYDCYLWKAWIFPSKTGMEGKDVNLPKSKSEEGILIQIILNSVSTAFDIVSATVVRLHFEFS